jgi:hypothetical protein
MKWFRWYRGTVSNPKLALVAVKANRPPEYEENPNGDITRYSVRLTEVIAVWAVMLEDAAKKEHWGICVRTPEYMAMVLRWFPEEIKNIINAMVEEAMIEPCNDGLKILNWNEYQYASDHDPTNINRQRKWYDKNKRKPNALGHRYERKPNANLTRTDTDTDTESKKDIARTKKQSARGISLRPDWKPTEKHLTQAQDLGLDRLAVERMAEDMRVWAVANRNRAIARKADWDATFLGWMRRNAPAKRSESTDSTPDWLKRDTERIRAEKAAKRAKQAERPPTNGNGTQRADHSEELLPSSDPLRENDDGQRSETPSYPPRH